MDDILAQYLIVTTQGLDNLMAQQYKQMFLIQTKVLALAQQLNNAIDKYYNNKLLEKTIMQIER